MKKVLSYFIAIMMAVTMIPCAAFAESECEHVWSEWETYDDITCVDQTAERYCEECGAQEEKTVPASTDHNWTAWEVYDEATCAEAGYKYRYCDDCGTEQEKVIPATGDHQWTKWFLPAGTSCLKGGNYVRYCDICGKESTKKFPVYSSHKWSGWLVWDEAMLNHKGTLINYCTRCSTDKYKNISAIKTIKLKKSTFAYDGNSKKPNTVVKDSAGNTLKKGTDYKITYQNSAGKTVSAPKNVGKYKAVIKFKGKYRGSVKRSFKIKPKATSITKVTSGTKSFTVKWSKRSTQVTGYQIKYSTNSDMSNAKTKLVTSYKTTSKKISGLKSGKKYYVKVRTYKTVNGTKFYSTWSGKKSVTTKKSSASTSNNNSNSAVSGGTVYITETGTKYHYDRNCRGLSNASEVWSVSLSTAKSQGLTLCGYED